MNTRKTLSRAEVTAIRDEAERYIKRRLDNQYGTITQEEIENLFETIKSIYNQNQQNTHENITKEIQKITRPSLLDYTINEADSLKIAYLLSIYTAANQYLENSNDQSYTQLQEHISNATQDLCEQTQKYNNPEGYTKTIAIISQLGKISRTEIRNIELMDSYQKEAVSALYQATVTAPEEPITEEPITEEFTTSLRQTLEEINAQLKRAKEIKKEKQKIKDFSRAKGDFKSDPTFEINTTIKLIEIRKTKLTDKIRNILGEESPDWLKNEVLTCTKLVSEMEESKLIEYIKSFDLKSLEPEQIKQWDKRARLAFVSHYTWKECKERLGGDLLDAKKARAFTHDFTEEDINTLAQANSETGLILSFNKKTAKQIADIIKSGSDDSKKRKTGWHLLEELETGFLHEEKELLDHVNESGCLLWRSYRHRLMEAILYNYKKKTDDFELKVNALIKEEIETSPADFSNNASLDAYIVVLSDPAAVRILSGRESNLDVLPNRLREEVKQENCLGKSVQRARQQGLTIKHLNEIIKKLDSHSPETALLLNELPWFFDGWTTEQFKEEINKPDLEPWLRWAILTQPTFVSSTASETLSQHVKELLESKQGLSPDQIKRLDKASRISFLSSMRSWEECKRILAGQPNNREILQKRLEAFSYGFDHDDIEKLKEAHSEAGLMVALNKHPGKIMGFIVSDPTNSEKRKLGLNVLKEIDDGIFKENHLIIDIIDQNYLLKSYRTVIAKKILYDYDKQKDGFTLEITRSIKEEIQKNPADFSREVSFDALMVALADPTIVNYLAERASRADVLRNAADNAMNTVANIPSNLRKALGLSENPSLQETLEAAKKIPTLIKTAGIEEKASLESVSLATDNYTKQEAEAEEKKEKSEAVSEINGDYYRSLERTCLGQALLTAASKDGTHLNPIEFNTLLDNLQKKDNNAYVSLLKQLPRLFEKDCNFFREKNQENLDASIKLINHYVNANQDVNFLVEKINEHLKNETMTPNDREFFQKLSMSHYKLIKNMYLEKRDLPNPWPVNVIKGALALFAAWGVYKGIKSIVTLDFLMPDFFKKADQKSNTVLSAALLILTASSIASTGGIVLIAILGAAAAVAASTFAYSAYVFIKKLADNAMSTKEEAKRIDSGLIQMFKNMKEDPSLKKQMLFASEESTERLAENILFCESHGIKILNNPAIDKKLRNELNTLCNGVYYKKHSTWASILNVAAIVPTLLSLGIFAGWSPWWQIRKMDKLIQKQKAERAHKEGDQPKARKLSSAIIGAGLEVKEAPTPAANDATNASLHYPGIPPFGSPRETQRNSSSPYPASPKLGRNK